MKKILALLLVIIGLGVFFYSRHEVPGVHVERTFTTSTDRMWEVLTDVESIKKWWGPGVFIAPVVQSDFKVGGKYLLSMEAPGWPRIYNSGVYQEIIPQEKIVYTMTFSDEAGMPVPPAYYKVPGTWPPVVKVTLLLKDVSGKTQLRVIEEGIPTEMSDMSRMGWEQQFDKIEKLIK